LRVAALPPWLFPGPGIPGGRTRNPLHDQGRVRSLWLAGHAARAPRPGPARDPDRPAPEQRTAAGILLDPPQYGKPRAAGDRACQDDRRAAGVAAAPC